MRRNPRSNRRRNLSVWEQILQADTKNVIGVLLLFFLVFLISFVSTKLIIIHRSRSSANSDIENVKSIVNESSDNSVFNDVANEVSDGSSTSNLDNDRSFTLCAIGDVMCHNTQYMDAFNSSTGEYDFSYVFNDISKYTTTPDITIGSLETSFAGAERGYSNYPTFNSPDSLAYSIRQIGVDVLSTAGNHCLDMGFDGLSRTIDVLDSYHLDHLGTYKSKEDQEKILYKYVRGTKIAFVNYTYGTNGIPVPEGKDFCVNLIDKDLIKSQLDTAKADGANLIVACMHWGTEYMTSPNDEQKDLSDFLFKNGVDIILGNHPHCLQPMEKRTVTLDDGSTKDCFVIYALGNFICDQTAENTRNSIILNLRITRSKDNKISIDNVNYIPIYMYKDPNLSSQKFRVLDIEKTLTFYEEGADTSIGAAMYQDLKVQLDKIKSIVGEEIVGQ